MRKTKKIRGVLLFIIFCNICVIGQFIYLKAYGNNECLSNEEIEQIIDDNNEVCTCCDEDESLSNEEVLAYLNSDDNPLLDMNKEEIENFFDSELSGKGELNDIGGEVTSPIDYLKKILKNVVMTMN